ncbi:MAG TPA: metalloregulator ArsR/SmtB family transcription factor [Streptosporangiaceae bacterium]|nr:metalloregulator ArsR/SmtB family transcription factor [Streptosporangiaceae bacterium]
METYGVDALGALGDPTRRAIFECLARRPMAVGQLSAELPVTRPAVSQHLKVLKQAGLVTDQVDGTRRIYRINQVGVQAIHHYLDQMWSQALTGFQLAAQQIARSEQNSLSSEAQEEA